MTISVRGEELQLIKERALYLPKDKILAISDLHVGKSAHFRKSGLQIPVGIAQQDLIRLAKVIENTQPETLLINGDLFHHDLNSDVDYFANWKMQFPALRFVLVKGNHDRLATKNYEDLGIEVFDPNFCTGSFCFVHDSTHCTVATLYPISGHIHPGVTLVGKAKQRMRFPCFYFGTNYAVLPAFSEFTGLYSLKKKKDDLVYAITPNRVIQV